MSTFISYSRVNSAFVVRLARDLKSAGFDVWLDQLDIPKGARWDDEIEKAVERATTFMIVLAPESMESQNVKDELSYAIDSGKQILPVVIKPCKVPLRLRRFQYVDFTDKPYKDSLADIKHLLSNTMQLAKPVPVEDAPVIEAEEAFVSFNDAMAQRELLSHPEPLKGEIVEVENPRRKAIALAVVIAAIGIAAIAVFAVSAARSRNVPAALPVTSSSTSTVEGPTETPTITPTPLPRQITDFRGVTMMLVDAGEFMMGSDNGPKDEAPAQKLFLSDFYIDKYEVTNAFYKACVASGQCKPPKKDASRTHNGYFNKSDYQKYPVVYVTWDMASDYCTWRGARLPTEAEWEKAARGPDGNTYPPGNDISCDQANYAGCGKDTEPVSSFSSGQSAYQVFDLAGNVSEWVNSLYGDYPYTSAQEDSMASGERVIRGGSFADSQEDVSATTRQKADPATAQDNLGFRCVGMPSGQTNESTLVTVTPTRRPTVTASAGNKNGKDGTPTPSPLVNPLTPTSTPLPTQTVGGPTATSTPTSTPTAYVPTDTDTPTSTPTTYVPADTDTPTPTPYVPKDTDTPTPTLTSYP